MARNVYLDHAATTPVDKQVLKAMMPYFSAHYANPSALYKEAIITNKAIIEARKTVAGVLKTNPDTIYFTSGGTESDNMAILGVAKANEKFGKHIITTAVEHHAVLYPLEQLEKMGWEITRLPVDKNGLVKASDVIRAIRQDTVLVSIIYANNEIGSVEPVPEIGRELLKYRRDNKTQYPYFHSDAAQAAGYLDLETEKLHVDLMTINGGKIYGPKGSGILFVRRGVKIEPIMFGGSQESGLRAGTENVSGIVGFAEALKIAQKSKDKESKRLLKLSEYFWKKINKAVPSAVLNGPKIGESRLSNNINANFLNVDGEALVIYLDSLGVMCATGSACGAVSREPSHVLKAVGLSEKEVLGSVRFTLGRETTKDDLDYTITAISKSLKMISARP